MPLVPDEDGPAITDATAPKASEGCGTYKTLSKFVITITTSANTYSLQVKVYQHEIGLWQRARRPPGSCLGVFGLMHTNGYPRLLAEEVTNRGDIFRGVESGERVLSPPLPPLHPPHSHLPRIQAQR
jgi:hypothetical protein